MKGVTKLVVESVSSLVISTHTPVKGVTVADDHQQQLKYHFNSHAREGRDTDKDLTYGGGRKFQLTRP